MEISNVRISNKYKSGDIIEEMVDEEANVSIGKSRQASHVNIHSLDPVDGELNSNPSESALKVKDNSEIAEKTNKTDHRVILDKIPPRNNSGTNFENLFNELLIPQAFNKIFTELIIKRIDPKDYFIYTSSRLNEMHKEIKDLKNEY